MSKDDQVQLRKRHTVQAKQNICAPDQFLIIQLAWHRFGALKSFLFFALCIRPAPIAAASPVGGKKSFKVFLSGSFFTHISHRFLILPCSWGHCPYTDKLTLFLPEASDTF